MPDASTSKFQTTSWTLVVSAAEAPTADSRRALATLCQMYWHPVYAFIRRNGHDRDHAQDLTQGFFAVLLEKNYLRDADRERGRFRSFLLASVKHFLANEWDKEHALKRGGDQVAVPIDLVDAEASYASDAPEQETPERLFERRWALALLEQVMFKLRAEYSSKGKAEQFDRLSVFLNGNPDEANYAKLAAEMSVSAGSLRVAVHRIRRQYGDLVRAEIAETVSTPEEIGEEVRFLLAALSA
jgi:DNA-directed RNA polymerase specialized sigma24 family protein